MQNNGTNLNIEFDNFINKAGQAYSIGNLPEAERQVRGALNAKPEDPHALMLLGVVQAKQGQLKVAAVTLIRTCERDPKSFPARMSLSHVLSDLQRYGEAIDYAKEAALLQPNDPWPHIQAGKCLQQIGKTTEAIGELRLAVALAPQLAAAHEALASTLGSHDKQRNPELDGMNRCEKLLDSQKFAEAETIARKLHESFPDSPKVHGLLARILLQQSRSAEALEYVTTAIKMAPKDALLVATHGMILQNLGRTEEACKNFEQAIALQPDQAFAYSLLAYGRKFTEGDLALIESMETLSRDFAQSPNHRQHLQYALGKAHQDLKHFGVAMDHFNEANRVTHLLRYGSKAFDRNEYRKSLELIENLISANFIRRFASSGIQSKTPIFVLGMMRSGTTLVEQVLSTLKLEALASNCFGWSTGMKCSYRAGRA